MIFYVHSSFGSLRKRGGGSEETSDMYVVKPSDESKRSVVIQGMVELPSVLGEGENGSCKRVGGGSN